MGIKRKTQGTTIGLLQDAVMFVGTHLGVSVVRIRLLVPTARRMLYGWCGHTKVCPYKTRY